MSKITSTYLYSDYSNSETIFLSAREQVVQNQAVFLVSKVCFILFFRYLYCKRDITSRRVYFWHRNMPICKIHTRKKKLQPYPVHRFNK